MSTSLSSTRRHSMFGAGAVAALMAAPVLAKAQPQAESPIQMLYDKYQSACRASEQAHEPVTALRAALTERWGSIPRNGSAQSTWGHDPDYWLMDAGSECCEQFDDEMWEVRDQLLQTPAATVAEMHLKLRVIADNQPVDLSGLDGYEVDNIHFLREAVQLLDQRRVLS